MDQLFESDEISCRASMTKKTGRHAIVLVLVFLLALCLGALVVESHTKIIRRAYDNFILDSRNHYLPCEQLPSESEVTQVVKGHPDEIREIEQVNPGFVGVEMDVAPCPGKADLIVWYGTHRDRVMIEAIIGGETFFGVPYRLHNR